jgi:hypothetical protein
MLQFKHLAYCRHAFTPSPRNAPEALMNLPKEGVGSAGCPLPRGLVCTAVVERTR